ncbi:Putative white-brown complex homolog protein 30 [Seminavis robusta]|uniref:White-brown complex homolog protein 30 n=1 Tax=Seminavis robusta TaxID=568900 RepID=A0A9N8EHK3_9STRA|nr:Putative white-brown complex homolog protein 30 [Seminavis robusta]|eukprot:Sro1014_g231410.1 Putative white-brown complex homolog protein 30 (674) ;mRNA; r:12182-15151
MKQNGSSNIAGSNHIGNSSRRYGMESSVLNFQDVNFVVGRGKNQRHILRDVGGKVKWGHVLAIMGPSGAGKTTLISALTLDAFYGSPYGTVTLNGVPMTDQIFKRHCYVVKQHDKHWPYLTCREALMYAAQLYEVADGKSVPIIVDDIIAKMGLDVCAKTRCARLSGGQRRRLSIAVALLKQPTLIFLDEPTSGLDAASAANIMQEIVRVAKDERLIIVCTIHQPSTKVYNGFDQVMIMSKGREAFAGEAHDAIPYFDRIGAPCPPNTNPAEFFLDLINADFSDDAAVDGILDTWEQHKQSNKQSGRDPTDQEGVAPGLRTNLCVEMFVMFRRHALLVLRDPILYIGRAIAFLLCNVFFAVVYWNARPNDQTKTLDKMWINIWLCAVTTNMGVVAVYALNDEFKSIVRESRNGMVSGFSYVLAKTILVTPLMLVFSVFAIGVPAFAIMNVPIEAMPMMIFLYAAMIFVFESVAECLAVWVDDPILGMLVFMNFWFAAFLFGGFVIPFDDLYIPWTWGYHVMPYSYYVRSAMYEAFVYVTFENCELGTPSAVCVQETTPGAGVPGIEIIEAFTFILPLAEPVDNTIRDILILVAIGGFWKLLYVVGVILKTRRVARILDPKKMPAVKGAPKKKSANGHMNGASTNSRVNRPPPKPPVPPPPAVYYLDNSEEYSV